MCKLATYSLAVPRGEQIQSGWMVNPQVEIAMYILHNSWWNMIRRLFNPVTDWLCCKILLMWHYLHGVDVNVANVNVFSLTKREVQTSFALHRCWSNDGVWDECVVGHGCCLDPVIKRWQPC